MINQSLINRLIFLTIIVFLISACEKKSTLETQPERESGHEQTSLQIEIVFLSTRDSISSIYSELGKKCEIYGINKNTGNPIRITSHQSEDNRNPRISPDGSKVAFVSFSEQLQPQIYLCDIDGQNLQRLLPENQFGESPHFFPDGQAIAYLDFQRDLWVTYSDGSANKKLTETGNCLIRDISNDGKYILYNSRHNNESEIYIFDFVTTSSKRLTDNQEYDLGCGFFPSDQEILFSSKRTGQSHIYKMNLNGTEVVQLTQKAGNGYCQVSPDGNKIVFESWRDGNNEIYIMDADGNNEFRLTQDSATDEKPLFSPNGKRIIFESNRSSKYQVYSIDTDGKNLINLSNSNAWDFDHDVIRPINN